MSNDGQMPENGTSQPPEANPNSAAFWQDIDRAYDTEHQHHKRMSELHRANISFAAQQFQSQMLGLILVGEAEMPLTAAHSGDAVGGNAAPPSDPTATP